MAGWQALPEKTLFFGWARFCQTFQALRVEAHMAETAALGRPLAVKFWTSGTSSNIRSLTSAGNYSLSSATTTANITQQTANPVADTYYTGSS